MSQDSYSKSANDIFLQYKPANSANNTNGGYGFKHGSLPNIVSSHEKEPRLALNPALISHPYHSLPGHLIINDGYTEVPYHSISGEENPLQTPSFDSSGAFPLAGYPGPSLVKYIPVRKGDFIREQFGKIDTTQIYPHLGHQHSTITEAEFPLPGLASGPFENYDFPKKRGTTEISRTFPNMTSQTDPTLKIEAKYVSLLKEVSGTNFAGFLVECLRGCHQHLSLDTFFNLLYSGKYSEGITLLAQKNSTQSFDSEPKRKALQFCCDILKIFQDSWSPGVSVPSWIENSQISCVNSHELLRTFLAIKVIFSCVERVESSVSGNFALPRHQVYKSYYIFCQSLITTQKFASPESVASITMSQSQLGRLIKLVFPNLSSRRLGRRGHSRFHYMGLWWNKDNVDDHMLKLLELEVPQINQYFENRATELAGNRKPKASETKQAESIENVPTSAQTPSIIDTDNRWRIPSNSFVDFSYTYPDSDCSPRVWDFTPEKVPQMSKWSTEIINKSSLALQAYNVDLVPLVRIFKSGNFTEDNEYELPKIVIRSIETLVSSSAEKISYIHVYLIVLLSIFPMIMSSDEEVSLASKTRLCRSLNTCVRDLQSEIDPADQVRLKPFIANLHRMVTICKLTSCKFHPGYAKRILEEKISEIEAPVSAKPDVARNRSRLDDLYINAILSSFQAFNWKLYPDKCISTEEADIHSIYMLANTLIKSSIMTKHDMQMLLFHTRCNNSTQLPQDLPYQVFKIVIQLLHEYALTDPLVKTLPIPVFNMILRNASEMVQSASVQQFHTPDAEFSKDAFKFWWVFFIMFQNYLDILSEVVSLNAMVK